MEPKQSILSPKYSHVSVLAPAGIVTGGVELLHQLVHCINLNGGSSSIIYFPVKREHQNIPAPYRGYNLKIDTSVRDLRNCAVIVPEIASSFRVVQAQKFVWWLSVDNFFGGEKPARRAYVLKIIELLRISMFERHNIHLYQSEYARDFLRKIAIRKTKPLSDYLSLEHKRFDASDKENIVAFNPRKGSEFTAKIIDAAPAHLKFVPIENMTPAEVNRLLSRCKVYIDFGSHPGKDRIPREAALAGATIIVGNRGAARNVIDIPIPEFFKIDLDERFVARTLSLLDFCLENFSEVYLLQEFFRQNLSNDSLRFTSEVWSLLFNVRSF